MVHFLKIQQFLDFVHTYPVNLSDAPFVPVLKLAHLLGLMKSTPRLRHPGYLKGSINQNLLCNEGKWIWQIQVSMTSPPGQGIQVSLGGGILSKAILSFSFKTCTSFIIYLLNILIAFNTKRVKSEWSWQSHNALLIKPLAKSQQRFQREHIRYVRSEYCLRIINHL